jgi:hypothetical protein
MPLTIKKIDKSLAECNRFIEAAIKAKQRIEKADLVRPCPSMENGTMKRASLDLTRALADLRK